MYRWTGATIAVARRASDLTPSTQWAIARTMVKQTLAFCVGVMAAVVAGCGHASIGSVMCVTADGTIALRGACGAEETPLTSGVLSEALRCPPDAEKVGPLCVDKYEASTWLIP